MAGSSSSKYLFWEVKNQIIAIIYVNIGSLSMGCGLGWLSPALGPLQSLSNNPLVTGPITLDEASWLGSIITLGAFTGILCFSWIQGRFGRKNALCLSALPFIMTWILVIIGNDIAYLYASRFIMGVSAGGLYVIIPLMVTEISDERIRGVLGSGISLMQYTGVLLAYLIGAYLPYTTVAYIMLIFPIIFLVCTIFLVPESPQYLLSRKRDKEAEISLRFYRNYSDSKEDNERLLAELEKMKLINEQNSPSLKIIDFVTPEARYGLTIGLSLMTLYVFNGTFIFLSYASNVFIESGSEMDANTSAIIIGGIQVVGIIVAIFLVDMVGRRSLLIASTAGCTFGLAAMGAHNYCATTGMDVKNLDWLPVTSLSLTFFAACSGLIPVTFVIMAEAFPINIRSSGSTFCLAYANVVLFIMLKVFPLMVEAFNLYVCTWIFAVACLIGILFSIFVVKETKGKTV